MTVTTPPSPDVIAFGRPVDWTTEATVGVVRFGPGNSRPFPSLPVETIRQFRCHGYLDDQQPQGRAPPAGELIEFVETVQSEYREKLIFNGYIGSLTSPKLGNRVQLEGIVIRGHDLPESLQQLVARRFSPELFSVDNFEIYLEW